MNNKKNKKLDDKLENQEFKEYLNLEKLEEDESFEKMLEDVFKKQNGKNNE